MSTEEKIWLSVKIALGAYLFAVGLYVLSLLYAQIWLRPQEKAECIAFGGTVHTLRGDFTCEYDFTRPAD